MLVDKAIYTVNLKHARAISGVHVYPGSTEILVRRGGKINPGLVAYHTLSATSVQRIIKISQSVLLELQHAKSVPFSSEARCRKKYKPGCRRRTMRGSHRAAYAMRLNRASGEQYKKGKRSPYSITERRVPELIPVGSQPASDLSHKPGGRLPLLSARYPRNP